MDVVSDRRTRKRNVTRQAISDVATRLFFARGFDQVTIDEIAEAADVGRMTVFNHFPRKEDMFFDREHEARELVLDAVRLRQSGVSPLRALQRLAHRLATEDHPVIRFFDGSRQFVGTVAASETLKARARAIREDVAAALTNVLAEAVGRPPGDPDAQLTSNFLLATWSTAFVQGHDVYRKDGDVNAAKARFLEVVDRGAAGIATAMAGTAYAAS
jgi:AcrR family transcriptional regulator